MMIVTPWPRPPVRGLAPNHLRVLPSHLFSSVIIKVIVILTIDDDIDRLYYHLYNLGEVILHFQQDCFYLQQPTWCPVSVCFPDLLFSPQLLTSNHLLLEHTSPASSWFLSCRLTLFQAHSFFKLLLTSNCLLWRFLSSSTLVSSHQPRLHFFEAGSAGWPAAVRCWQVCRLAESVLLLLPQSADLKDRFLRSPQWRSDRHNLKCQT